MRSIIGILAVFLFVPAWVSGQNSERIVFDAKDSASGYYLAVPPPKGEIKGVVVLFCSFSAPESMLPETRIPQVAYANNILTVLASINEKLYIDTPTVNRINTILLHVRERFGVDTSKLALGAFDYAGNVILRYAELAHQYPAQYPMKPKAVFIVDGPVDLAGLWNWCERQIKKNYYQGSVGDAKYIQGVLKKEIGSVQDNPKRYQELSPFYKDRQEPGNEQYLKNTALRLYYDADITWQLKNRRNSYYDTHLPDGSELISRLLLSGNEGAEFVASGRPGVRSNGVRHPNTLSIVDEPDFIQWVKQTLDIFDPASWVAPYYFPRPEGWNTELFALPPAFAPGIDLKGVEDLRFAPGWEDAKSENYWSYIYLWWIQSGQQLNAARLQDYLKAYYEGLVGQNILRRKIPKDRIVPTQVTIKEVKAAEGDVGSYKGTISMLDYMTQRPIVLNCIIHVKNCEASGRRAVFFEISPRAYGHPIWQQMLDVRQQFSCKKLAGS
jgi:hypothetical protein